MSEEKNTENLFFFLSGPIWAINKSESPLTIEYNANALIRLRITNKASANKIAILVFAF